MKQHNQSIEAMMEDAKQAVEAFNDWNDAQGDYWRLGDITIVRGVWPLGLGWMLVKKHYADPKMWFCVVRDYASNLIGSADIESISELDVEGVLRCRCGVWIHEDDMRIEDRIDRDVEAAAACQKVVAKIFTDFFHTNETDEDPDYEHMMDVLNGYASRLSDYLHNGEANV